MLIDRTHRSWAITAAAMLGIGTASYVAYAATTVGGPRGGTVAGIIYGSVGSAMMLFAGLLGLRKKFPVWRVGRGASWMRGHLWLGSLSFPFILFHSAFHMGNGALTRTLMILFLIVFLSGILGAGLQQSLPRIMTERLPLETIYDQIDRVRQQLAEEASLLVSDIVAALEGDLAKAGKEQRAEAASAGTLGNLTVASGLGADDGASATVKEFLKSGLEPFLMRSGGHGLPLSNNGQAKGMFQQLRILLPKTLWPKLDDLESICGEKRQLDRQSRLHKLLHGWLIVHIPASYALLLLGGIHAVVALRY